MGMFAKGLMIYLFLAIAISCAAPQYVFTNSGSPQQNTFLSWFDLNYDGQNINVVNAELSSATNNATTSFTTPTTPGSSGSLLGWIDPIFQLFGWIKLIFVLLFSPIILLTGGALAGAPSGLIMILGIPLVFMVVIGLIGFIRSGQM